jgi:phosphoglycolate phosphatase
LSKAIIFDFDGTLINSKPVIEECFHKTTKELAPDRLKISKNILIGPPLRQTVSEILGDPQHPLIEKFIKSFIQVHDNELLKRSMPYPGVNDTLINLHQHGVKMAIATNKRMLPTKKIIKNFGWDDLFVYIECTDTYKIIQNKSQMINKIVMKNSNFKTAFFVGDTVDDGLSAIKNKILFIKVNYGYGKDQDWTKIKSHLSIDNFEEIKNII